MLFLGAFGWFSLFATPTPLLMYESAVLVRAAALAGLAWWGARARRLMPSGSLQEQGQFTEDSS
jgi:hypothetical protein